MKVLITSGGTKVPIDTVRSITNMSTGTFGSKIANEFLNLGHEVLFLRAKGSKSPFSATIDLMNGYTTDEFNQWYNERAALLKRYFEAEYVTFEDYQASLKFWLQHSKPDLVVLAAAVSDYGVNNPLNGKLRSALNLTVQLSPLPKVISEVKTWLPSCKLVGFKLLVDSTDEQLKQAIEKSFEANDCDMVVGNDLRDIKNANHKLLIAKKLGSAIKYETFKQVEENPNYLAKVVAQNSLIL